MRKNHGSENRFAESLCVRLAETDNFDQDNRFAERKGNRFDPNSAHSSTHVKSRIQRKGIPKTFNFSEISLSDFHQLPSIPGTRSDQLH
jgi:hypothetical protein